MGTFVTVAILCAPFVSLLAAVNSVLEGRRERKQQRLEDEWEEQEERRWRRAVLRAQRKEKRARKRRRAYEKELLDAARALKRMEKRGKK